MNNVKIILWPIWDRIWSIPNDEEFNPIFKYDEKIWGTDREWKVMLLNSSMDRIVY